MSEHDPDHPNLPALQHGYAMRVPRSDMIELVAPGGVVCLSIRLGPAGPMVEVHAASLRVATEGELVLDCDRLEVNARTDISLISAGGIIQDAHGDVIVRADGEIASEAAGQQHHARRGSVDIRANDDVMLEGERVKLNGPRAFALPPVDLRSRQRPTSLNRDAIAAPEPEQPQVEPAHRLDEGEPS